MSIEARLNPTAMIKGATWSTAAQCGAAGCGITPLNPGVIQPKVPAIEIDEIKDAGETDIDQANFSAIDFALDFNYQWDGLENVLWAMLMGTAGAPTQQGATAAYLHTLAPKDSVFGIFGTYATQKEDKIHVVPSFKVMKASVSMSNGMIKNSFSLRGNKVTDADAVVTSLASVTWPSIHNRAKMFQSVFRMNAQTGADFNGGGSDNVLPKSFSLDFERKMDTEHTSGSQTIVEPRETDKYSVKLTMEFSRMDAANALYFANWLAKAEKKADITITGPLIASTYYYYQKFQLPRLAIEDVEYPNNKVIPAKIVMRSLVADTAPTGMTAITRPINITLINTRVTDLLA